MTDQKAHPPIHRYVILMRFLGVLYLLVGLNFFFLPHLVLDIINIIPEAYPIFLITPKAQAHFWPVLATSMMLMLTALCFLAAKSPEIRGYAQVHLLSKLASSVGFLLMFFFHEKYFAYLLGFLTDFPLALLVFGAMRWLPEAK